MTNSYFQTCVHSDSVHLTAVSTPLGLYERLVPSIHQRWVTHALRHLLGRICHIYLDDIIVWSDSLEDHASRCRQIFEALRAAKLYLNLKKTQLFCTEVDFLGHHISE